MKRRLRGAATVARDGASFRWHRRVGRLASAALMKWLSLIPVLALAFLVNACEMHPASDAPEEGTTEFGKHENGGEEKAEAKPAAEATPASKPEAATPAPEAKPGEAPKFFPENK